MKTGTITGFYSRRYVELHGGKVTWTKSTTYKENDEMSQRPISGASIVPLLEDNKIVKKHKSLFVFVVYLPFDPRTMHLKPLVFAAESEHDMNEWISAFRIASNWQYYPLALQPYPRRVTGLIVVEVISVDNVIGVDWGKTSDPYVVIEFNRMRARTPTHYERLGTVYNHFVSIPVYLDDPNNTLNIYVFDEDAIGEDSPLGGVSLPLHSLAFHQEKVWNQVSLKSVYGLKPPPDSSSDPFGTVSFRTYYSSSKVTQFLPLTGRAAIMKAPGSPSSSPTTPISRATSPNLAASLPTSPGGKSSIAASTFVDSEPEENETQQIVEDPTSEPDEEVVDDSVKAAMDPTASASAAASKLRLKKSAVAAAANEKFDPNPFDYEFSIDMMKLQLARVVAIFALFKSFKTISYFLNWRDPRWTVFMYSWISWISFIEPGSGLIFVFVMLGRKLLEAHPAFPDFWQELKLLADIATVRLGFILDTVQYLRGTLMKNARERMAASNFAKKRKTVEDLQEEHSTLFTQSTLVTRALSDDFIQYRVYECQRRTMPKAGDVLSAMVAAPAAATANAIRKIGAGEDDTEAKRLHIRKMFMAFSGDHLRNGTETHWVSATGMPLLDSPATVMDGIKIKWTVLIDKKSTDENGWEYSRKLPPINSQSVSDIAETWARGTTEFGPSGEGRRSSRRSTTMGGAHRRCLISSQAVEFDPKSTSWGNNHPFDSKLNMTRHWTRRRVWVGVPIRAAFESEDPVNLNEIVASMEDKANDAEELATHKDDKDSNRGLLAKYRAILREGKKLQSSIFEVSSKIESLKNLCTWKSRWISSAIFSVIIFLMTLSLVLPQPVVLWLILTFLLLDHLSDIQRKEKLMTPFLNAVAVEIESSKFSSVWKRDLTLRLGSFYTRLDDVNADYSASIVYGLFNRACRRLGWRNVRLHLQKFTDPSDGVNTGGPVTVAMLLEDIYTMYHNGNEDWWKRVKTTVHPKNLIQSHLVSDWEEYNPTSVFSGQPAGTGAH